jgi:hypothetical protein
MSKENLIFLETIKDGNISKSVNAAITVLRGKFKQ